MSFHPAAAPDITLGRYRLLSRIATGGMGEVWRAEDGLLHREVAVKTLRRELSGDPGFLTRFRLEARHTAALSHPGIASVFDYGESGGDSDHPDLAYLVMELVDGEPLSAVLQREGRLEPERALDVLAQTATALQAAHDAGVVHRDVKPGNILVRPDGTVKITDFGISRAVDAAPITATGQVLGTAYYLAPEQAAGKEVTAASDLYALGVVGYECLSGVRPFRGENSVTIALQQLREDPPPLPADVPAPARAVVEQAMAKDPAARFPSATAMAQAAGRARALLLAGGARTAVLDPPTAVLDPVPPTAVLSPPTTHRPPRRRTRPRWPRPGVLLLIAIVLGLLIALVVRSLADQAPANPTRSGSPTATRSATASPASSASAPPARSAGVLVAPGAYLGRDYQQVRSELAGLGLTVRPSYTGSGGHPGTVTAVSPSGTIPAGSTITVTVVPSKGAPAQQGDKHGKDAGGNHKPGHKDKKGKG